MLSNLPVVEAMGQKMGWLSKRQRVLSNNIANANTPDFAPSDLKELNFQKLVDSTGGTSGVKPVSLARTNATHLDITGMKAGQLPDSQEMEEVYETSPDGNGVNLEEQMIKSSQAAGDYQMVSNLYSRHVRILNAAMQGR